MNRVEFTEKIVDLLRWMDDAGEHPIIDFVKDWMKSRSGYSTKDYRSVMELKFAHVIKTDVQWIYTL